jgi:hypothetical protein
MGGPSFIPFFSRRIGLVEEEQVPVAYGAKVYGKLGNTSLAVLDVRTRPFSGDEVALSAENFVAARVYQNILEESKVGLILTSGIPTNANDPYTAGPNTLAGIDFDFKTSRFLGDKNFAAQAWAAYNWNPRQVGTHHGLGVRLDYPNDLWDVSANYN